MSHLPDSLPSQMTDFLRESSDIMRLADPNGQLVLPSRRIMPNFDSIGLRLLLFY